MYSEHSGQRRGLLRPVTASGGGPIFRNLPLFGFLIGLLFFFFIFNIYQAQRAELYEIRNQIELEKSRYIKTKSENINFKAQLENYKSSEASLKNELQSVRLNQKECSEKLAEWDNNLLSNQINLKHLQSDKNACFTALDSMKAELALAKLTLTNLQANSKSMGSEMEAPKKIIESLKTRLQGKDAQESISQTNLAASPLAVTQDANELESRKNTSIQNEKLTNKIEHNPSLNASATNLFQQEVVLPESVALRAPEHIVVTVTKSSNNLHAPTIIPVPRNAAQNDQLNFLASPLQLEKQSLEAKTAENLRLPNIPELQLNLDNVLRMNEQLPFIHKKDQMKKNVENGNDRDGKQVIGGEYIDKELEDA
ncbi:hypothetical protein ACH3XW_13915 [Acanthocheilonema viteae]|uniref:Uncharacterized protein n=1 Tax=Acanthocheilonema viteae TaxID=6277 RepID=A0A498SBG2_ACAVI|nr:unnamed protein product [Acanthocheilonema viteae]